MGTEWGREETIVWQPHMPIYSYMALAVTFVCAVLFVFEWHAFQQSALQKAYTGAYLRATVGAQFGMHGKFRLVMLGGSKAHPDRPALPGDLVPGLTLLPNGTTLPVVLSPAAAAQGYRAFGRANVKSYTDAAISGWLRAAIFGNKGLLRIYAWPFGETLLVLVLAFSFSMPRDIARLKELKYGRRLKGPVMLSARAFNRIVRGAGIGIRTAERKTVVRIPRANEAQHIEIIGDTGTGKSTIITQMLQQIRERKESAIVYDPACEFVRRFYQADRDVILNPLDARCPYWGPSEELRRKAEAKAIAASLYQPTSDKKGEFFTETPQKIFAHLLTFGPTPQQLVEWMSNPAEIDARVAGTELAAIIEPGAQQQRAGVLASLGLIADSLRMLPTKEQANGKTWSATTWAEKREGWIFITSQATEREALRPLHSLWIDLLVLRLLNAPTAAQRPVWFVLDELASLQRLPQLHTAITENRKSKNPLILGFQGKAQLETIYGHVAEVMLSQPATKIFLRTTEPKAAKWVSEAIGNVEIERMRETHVHGTREGKSFAVDRQTEPLVMDSEITGLADKHAFLKLGNNVARFAFAYCDLPAIARDFQPRNVEDDELGFDPHTLTPKPKPASPRPDLPASAVLLADPDEAPKTPATPTEEAAEIEKRKRKREKRGKGTDTLTHTASEATTEKDSASTTDTEADETLSGVVPPAVLLPPSSDVPSADGL